MKSFLWVVLFSVTFVGRCVGDTYTWNGATLHLYSGTAQVAMLLTDSQNRRVGFEQASMSPRYQDIPNSYAGTELQDNHEAGEAPGEPSQFEGITRIVEGVYSLRLLGLRKGHYCVSVNAETYDNKQQLKHEILKGEIGKGEIINYKIVCKSIPVFTFMISKK